MHSVPSEKESPLARQRGRKTAQRGVFEITPPTRATSATPATPGTYRIRVYFVDPKTGQSRERDRLITAASALDAARIRAEESASAVEARGAGERLTLRTYATSWLTRKLLSVRPSTAKHYASTLEAAILPTLGDTYVDALTRDDVIAWLSTQASLGHSPHTVNGRLRVLRTVLRDAVAELELTRDPIARVASLPTEQDDDEDEDDDRGKHLEASELRALLEAAERVTPTWHPLFLTLALTGGRWGEISALRWRDLDLEKGELRIRRAHVRGIVGSPKTAASRRRVPIPEVLAETLRHHHREQLAGRRTQSEAGWAFPSTTGGLMQPSSARKPLAKAAKEAGLDVRPSPHWFRHTLNRLLRQVEPGVVQRAITGHVTEAMSEHYDRVSLGEKQGAVGRVLELVLRSTGTEPGTGENRGQNRGQTDGTK